LSFQKGKYVKVVLLYFVCVYLTGVVGLHWIILLQESNFVGRDQSIWIHIKNNLLKIWLVIKLKGNKSYKKGIKWVNFKSNLECTNIGHYLTTFFSRISLHVFPVK
jgi:hypothetical protein